MHRNFSWTRETVAMVGKLTGLTARYDMRITATLRRLNSGALNFWVALLANAHQVGLGGTPSPDTLPPSLKNLNEATNCVTPKRVSGLGVLFVATRVTAWELLDVCPRGHS
jgi:hypothetical protein